MTKQQLKELRAKARETMNAARLRTFEGLEKTTDKAAKEIIESLERLTEIVYRVIHRPEGDQQSNSK